MTDLSSQSQSPTSGRAPAARRRRRHPAAISRIVVAGAAATSTFGVVTAMGLSQRSEAVPTPVAPAISPAPVVFPDGPVTQNPVVPTPAPVPTPAVVDRGVTRTPPAPVTTPPRSSGAGSRSSAS